MLKSVFIASILCIAAVVCRADDSPPSAGMLRYPDVSASQIVFLYANDLWVVSRDGGVASPLASPAGAELFPRFSADGKTIAFVGNYGGGRDIYTLPAEGGEPQRITWHPASETLCDWGPDDELLFSSNGLSGLSRMPQLFTVSSGKPDMVQLPVPYGTNGAISDDGKWLAYTPYSRDTRTWKRYRGGMASDIWLFNLKTRKSKRITDFEGTDTLPMWHGEDVYYLSDAGDEHRLNIWCHDTKSGKSRQVTHFEDYDVKWPSVGPGADGDGEIVFQNGSHLHLLDLKTDEASIVQVTVPGAHPKIATHIVDASENITGADVSPKGTRIAIEARGDIWTAPVKNGTPRNLTRSSSSAERSPSWSPDGRWIAFFADDTGEYELYIIQSDGKGETRQLTDDGEVFRYSPTWSPDSKYIAFTDKTGAAWLHEVESGETVHIVTDPWGGQPQLSWSHNSEWIVFDLTADAKAAKSSIHVYNVADATTTQLTSGFFNDGSPVFDAKGEFIYFASGRNFTSPKYEDQGTTFIYNDTGVLLALPLRSDVKNPLLPKSDEVEFKTEEESDTETSKAKKDDESDKKESKRARKKRKRKLKESAGKDADDEKKDSDKADAAAADFAIDADGIERRAFQLPVAPGNFRTLVVNAKNQLIYSRSSGRGAASPPKIQLYDLNADEPEEKTVVSGAGRFGLSSDGKKLLVSSSGKMYVIDAATDQKLSKAVSTDAMDVAINPREEWLQIFTDAWRIERDFFYDPAMHGVDWPAVKEQYAAMLPDCTSREDLGFVIGEMIAEINVGHAYYRGAGSEDQPSADVGLPGCDFTLADGGWKIDTIYEGAVWDVDARNPLRDAGIGSGDIVTAVNGIPVNSDRSIYAALEGLGGRTVTLGVKGPKRKSEPRDAVVRLLKSDSNLRFRHWIEQNRLMVEKLSKGKIGYIFVTNTQLPGQNDLIRHLYGQLEKEALIIDERWNGGGQIPTRFIELLNRPATNLWARRDGRDWVWPPDAHQGPKCMLINGMSGSGGDMFPALFRQAEIGPLIGRRTWGGLVGISGNPGMVDGSGVTAPTFAYYENDGTWGIEGHGVDPDIDVIDDPAKMQNGHDPQLEVAIKEMLKAIKTGGWQPPERPDYPDRKGFGIEAKDK
jgi:tricorn protease